MTEHTATANYDADKSISDTTPADSAIKYILNNLIAIIHTTGPAVIRQADPESLHSYRIAVRKTRTLLGECDHVFTKHDLKKAKRYFARLGDLTGPARDMDIFMEEIKNYSARLTPEQEKHIQPLICELRRDHAEKYQNLINELTSENYSRSLERYIHFLQTPAPQSTTLKFAKWPIKTMTDKYICKTYKKAARHAEKINQLTPPEFIHKQRRLFKKLRYLIDLFQTLYDEKYLKKIIKALKKIQDTLGNFNDASIQAGYLRNYISQHNKTNDLSNECHELLSNLLARLEDKTTQARKHFLDQIGNFSTKEMRQTIETLCKKCHA